MRALAVAVVGVSCLVVAACSDEAADPGLVQPDASALPDFVAHEDTRVVDSATADSERDSAATTSSDEDTVVMPDIAPGESGASCASDGECTSGTCANGHCCTLGAGETACCAVDADCGAFAGFDGRAVCTSVGPEGCGGNREVGRCGERYVCEVAIIDEPSACGGTPCSDGMCGAGGATVAGLCDFEGHCTVPDPVPCTDGNACTSDRCAVDGVQVGCVSTPLTGVASEGCYDFAPSTRNQGECHDGTVLCSQGAVVGCFEAKGPAAEHCNGRDEDCDGSTDEDTEPECYPYLCHGFFGCGVVCTSDADCAAGNYCDGITCVSTGEDGAPCGKDSECASDHCDNGYCCSGGMCCHDTGDCAALDALTCDDAEGCAGTRTTGVCDGDFSCDTIGEPDDSACGGAVCAGAHCEGDRAVPDARCDSAGTCVMEAGTSCSPYGCAAGECLTACHGQSGCAANAQCHEGRCGGLAAGMRCGGDTDCASNHCNSGFCCGSGTCCGTTADCGALDQPALCDDGPSCSGSQKVGLCSAASRCELATVDADEACAGQRCGDNQCVNLSGASFVLEGWEKRVCDDGGSCATTTIDCRDGGSGCFGSSGAFSYSGCSPSRAACIDFQGQRCFE